ncbi:hypothetical protein GXW82_27740 [Streptacidiphilus sp. 4-A2]|nr:hypothetical protein [Streptacidiphilus sp. 4-A2]
MPIKVLHGQPSPEELAAVLAVVSARAAAFAARAEDDAPASLGRPRPCDERSAAPRRARLAYLRLAALTGTTPSAGPGTPLVPGPAPPFRRPSSC